MKNFPWLSLALLFATYSSLGWFLIHATAQPYIWVLVFLFTIAQALLLTTWFDGLRHFARAWLKSDVGYFTLVIISALSFTVILVWFKTFGYFLVLVSAELLARLDLQNAGFNRVQALFLLTLFSVAGLITGWAVSEYPVFRPAA